MTELLLPPSPNWFQFNGLSSRQSDKIIATACFKNIIVYSLDNNNDTTTSIKIVKKIYHHHGKVLGVAMYPDEIHHEYGKTMAVIGDTGTLVIINFHTGEFLYQLEDKKKYVYESLCWGMVDGEDVVAAVGQSGFLIIRKPKSKGRDFNLSKRTLSSILTLPHERSQALVCSEKSIYLVSLKRGEIITEMKGHDSSIYSMKWYTGTNNPMSAESFPSNTRWNRDDEEIKPKNTRWKRDDEQNNIDKQNEIENIEKLQETSTGPYFVTSDYARNIFLWDLSLKRYIVKTTVPMAGQYTRKSYRGKPETKHHISLSWYNGQLYSSSVSGDIMSWMLSPKGSKSTTVYSQHTRPIYNIESVGNLMVTSAQDRIINGYNVATKKNIFQLQTMGGCSTTMTFSPHDAHRLAIGLQDGSIRVVTFGDSDKLMKSYTSHQNNRDRILSLSWHPCQETSILFGTTEGKVGVADILSNKIVTFAYFHSKSVYKVEWAPPLCPKSSALDVNDWYAYTFGDRELIIRDSSNLLKDPISVNQLLQLDCTEKSFGLSEFSFSPDFDYLALGSIDGVVKIFNRLTGEHLMTLNLARKTIQHLLWKPPSSADITYTLAIASAESVIYIIDLDKHLQESKSASTPLTIMTATQELSAHSARIVWLSWSSHNDSILASASYDRTVQIWNASTGQPLHNYGGHCQRVFRVEFSPLDPDLVFSFGEENCIHQWRPSKIKDRTPKDSSASTKLSKSKRSHKEVLEKETKNIDAESVTSSITSASTDSIVVNQNGTGTAYKRTPKSLFPLLHTVSKKKKSFLHLCILTSLEYHKAKRAREILTNDVSDDDDLDGDLSYDAPVDKGDTLEMDDYAKETIEKYKCYYRNDAQQPKSHEICQYLDFFGSVSDIDKVVTQEIMNHDSHENFTNATILHSWKGSLESRINFAANHKLLDVFLVSLAPQISVSLWEFASQAYAEQLLEDGQPITGATYLIAINKEEEAIDMLIKTKHFREALTITKYRMGFNRQIIEKVINSWISVSIFEGNYELACTLQLSICRFEQAARLMARRTECGSLIVAALLYQIADCHDLSISMAILALKEGSLKHDWQKMDVIMQQFPSLRVSS